MIHTTTLTTIAAAVLAAAVPLAAQAQQTTARTDLTISVGAQAAIDTTVNCAFSTNGVLIPVVQRADDRILRFTTDNDVAQATEASQAAGPTTGARQSPGYPTIQVSWTRSTSTAVNRFVKIQAKLPEAFFTGLNSAIKSGGTYEYAQPKTNLARSPSRDKATSHIVFTGALTGDIAGTLAGQSYDPNTKIATLWIGPSDVGDATELPALGPTNVALDITLVPASGKSYLATAVTVQPVAVEWTCSAVSALGS